MLLMPNSLIFLGKFIPPKLLKTAAEDSHETLGFSNHNFEMSLIHGFGKQDIDISFVSLPGVYSYPRFNSRAFINKESFEIDGHNAKSIGYFNLTGFNRFGRIINGAKTIVRIVKENHGKTAIVINTPTPELLLAVKFASSILGKHLDTTLIVPDIPSMVTNMDKSRGFIKKVFNSMDEYAIKLARKCDRLVLLTEQMMDFFPDGNQHIVMEGVVDVESMDQETDNSSTGTDYFLYTGTLRKIFGVMDLLNAFEEANLPDEVELWICGSGDAADEIKECASRNPRIKFLGLIDSKKALSLQRGALALVNPRTSEGEFTKYSFPSKTMEYLLSGNPVIAHKLPGIPTEYDQYIVYPEKETISALAQALFNIANITRAERNELGRQGREFVISQKNSLVQTKRILDFINQ